jgi:hypothetical protein
MQEEGLELSEDLGLESWRSLSGWKIEGGRWKASPNVLIDAYFYFKPHSRSIREDSDCQPLIISTSKLEKASPDMMFRASVVHGCIQVASSRLFSWG